ncbi:MAG: N-acetylmuramoyl-L-alanine amidase [Gammaproteobacteria bacterium]|nr:N-acetylmuramoyl-L-alanine amidase [Gammaproteobacteria bacterium]
MLRIFLILLLLTVSISTWSASIEGLRLSQAKENTRLVFDLNRSVKYTTFTLSNPERIVIDLSQTIKPTHLKIPDLSQSPLRSIRYAAWDKNTLRIVLDLKQPLKYESQTLAPNQGYPHRLVIDLKSTVNSVAKETKLEPKPTVATVITPSTPVKTVTPPQVTPKPAKIVITKPEPIMTVTKSTKTMAKRQIIIAIDAGHGGQDSGALGKRGTKEKTVVLAIAKRLAKLVNKEPGMRAYLTRDRDIFITLRQRIKKARNNNADMFISIHADAFTNTKARGASVFVLSERGASSEAAQLLADKENAADLAGGISLEDKDDLLASVLLDLSQTASLEASLEVANTVLSGLKRVGNVHKKHVESASFVVLKSPDIPSVLVETAFISNPAEERKLNSSSHQNKLARAMMSGIRNYFQRNPLPGSSVPQQHTVSRGDTLSIIAHRYQVSMSQLKLANNLKTSNIKIGEVLLIP